MNHACGLTVVLFSYERSFAHIYVLATHSLNSLVNLDHFVLEILLLSLHCLRLHADRHLHEHLLHFLLVVLQLGKHGDSITLRHESRAGRLMTQLFFFYLCRISCILLLFGFLLVFLQVLGHFASFVRLWSRCRSLFGRKRSSPLLNRLIVFFVFLDVSDACLW